MDYIGNELELFKNAKNWKNYYSSKMNPFIQGDVLEVGAGIGANSDFLINEKVTSWTFVEPDKILADQINSNCKKIHVLKNIVVGTIDKVDSLYDTIIYIDVLEHIEDSVGEIEKIKSKLKKNGRMIILVPAFQFLFNEFDTNIGHYRRYNKNLLLKEVNNTLFVRKLFYLDSIGVMASVANKFFMKKANISLAQVKFWDKYIIRMSYFFDIIFMRKFGKSLIGIFEKK
jgi:2-polyprenyl-3-methyl-5-hydroxy-6-metoxy-1,4-benzoquinol methylase